jgi:Flp pilus assembly protein TadD
MGTRSELLDGGSRRLNLFLAILLFAVTVCIAPSALAKDLKIHLPKRSAQTPVQRLNREGVEAIRKHQYQKAKELFYQAYLYDPNDPFTLNNLGYIAELQGELQRAKSFYDLAAQQTTDAVIDLASSDQIKGKPFTMAGRMQDGPMRSNRVNVEAVRLLSEGRASEADLLLQRELTVDPQNPFTLNNLGVAKEMEGDFTEAYNYYTAAANTHSSEAVILALSGAWRGKPVSEMAAASAKKVKQELAAPGTDVRVALLNARGVSELNRHDRHSAGLDFLAAYRLDPNNAFSLNNLGYLSEINGDLETAQTFYESAQRAQKANLSVGLATRHSAEGQKMFAVANDNAQQTETRMDQLSEARRRNPGPIQLKRRDGTPVDDSTPSPAPQAPQVPQPSTPPDSQPPHLP